jgi:hypothetical protein
VVIEAAGGEHHAMVHQVLVVASRTASSDALLAAMQERARERPTRFTLLVPGGAKLPPGMLDAAVTRHVEAGLDVEVRLGDEDPLVAVRDIWGPASHDEILVSTLPDQTSRWLRIGLPFRIQHMTGALVRHVTDDRDPRDVDAVPVAEPRARVRRDSMTAAPPPPAALPGRRRRLLSSLR